MTSLHPRLLGLGCPMIDATVEDVDPEFFVERSLKTNSTHRMSRREVDEIIEGFRALGHRTTLTFGGSTDNVVRGVQHLLSRNAGSMSGRETVLQSHVSYVGCVGDDDDGRAIERKMAKEGIRSVLKVSTTQRTAACLILLANEACGLATTGDPSDTDRNPDNTSTSISQKSRAHNPRCLVTSIGAAAEIDQDFIGSSDVKQLVDGCSMLYLTSFVLNCCPDAVESLISTANYESKFVVFNLGAAFLCRLHRRRIYRILPNVSLLFGNAEELAALMEENEDAESTQNEASELLRLTESLRHRWRAASKDGAANGVVITNGARRFVTGVGQSRARIREVASVDPKRIVDTNGAGDAFVAGFLAQLMKTTTTTTTKESAVSETNFDECVEKGKEFAAVVVQRRGFRLD